jgi:hypothetical protein
MRIRILLQCDGYVICMQIILEQMIQQRPTKICAMQIMNLVYVLNVSVS